MASIRSQWFILVPLAVLAIALGYWGFLVCDPSRPCHAISQADALFRAINLLRLSGNYSLGPDPGSWWLHSSHSRPSRCSAASSS